MSENDAIIIKGKIERIEHHQKLHKDDLSEVAMRQLEQGEALKRIEHALTGNPMNGNKGLVDEIKEIQKLKDTALVHKVYFGLIGIVLMASGMISKMFKLIF